MSSQDSGERIEARRGTGGDDRVAGYRPIWFMHHGGLDSEYGEKYTGALATYTSKHAPMAVHAPDAGKTFFTYGGVGEHEQDLWIMVGTYDHDSHEVTRPTIVDRKSEADTLHDTETVYDCHDNATLCLDDDGHVWVFVAGRGTVRPGRVYRSVEPHSADAFEQTYEQERFAYPQPWYVHDRFLLCWTRYTDEWNRELYWQTSPDGHEWSEPSKLAGFPAHYQTSERHDDTVVTAFNWHVDGAPDNRTDLYALRTPDTGETWETLAGTPIDPPLVRPDNAALVYDYHAEDRLVYLNDVTTDADGNPAVVYVTSDGFEPGPKNDPRHWEVARWDGTEWRIHEIADTDHNYDSGSVYHREGDWYVLGPTGDGPQPYYTGGEMAVWRSTDDCRAWERTHTFPAQDGYNANYARRPWQAVAPFEAFWTDADAAEPSPSRLYFGSLDGEYYRLPHDMDGETAEPEQIDIS